jgi:Holliday junction resolvase RusA-like endonuclease
VDNYFALEDSRLWTVNNLPQQIDADNRLKPCRDALSTLLGIDDKHFFSGYFEKVSTNSKELECSAIRISLMTPRSLQDLREQIKAERMNPAIS